MKIKTILGVLVGLLFCASTSFAQLAWSEKEFYLTVDHVSINTGGTNIGERGVTALEAMYGSLGTLKLGANTFELGLLSLGIGATGEVGTQSTAFDGQVGFVWACTAQRGVCFEFPKVARAPTATDNDNRYMFGFTFRPAAVLAPVQ